RAGDAARTRRGRAGGDLRGARIGAGAGAHGRAAADEARCPGRPCPGRAGPVREVRGASPAGGDRVGAHLFRGGGAPHPRRLPVASGQRDPDRLGRVAGLPGGARRPRGARRRRLPLGRGGTRHALGRPGHGGHRRRGSVVRNPDLVIYAAATASRAVDAEGTLRGKRTRNTVPSGSEEVTLIKPPCDRAISWAMKRPRPRPIRWAPDESPSRPLRNASKMNGSDVAGMGSPRLATSMRTSVSPPSARKSIGDRGAPCWTALPTRL